MTRSRPPRLATWLLRRFGCSSNNDAVIGDLAERYSKVKTPIWYWRQVIVSIVIGALNDIRGHKLLTLRDLVLGWVVLWASVGSIYQFLQVATDEWLPGAHFRLDQFLRNVFPTIHSWGFLRAYADLVEFHPNAIPMAIGLLAPVLSGIVTGWIVAKVHHPHDRSLLLLLNTALFLFWVSTLNWDSFVTWAGIPLMTGVFIGGLLKRNPDPEAEAA